MSTDQSGATVVPEWQAAQKNVDACMPPGAEDGRKYQHRWVWCAWGGLTPWGNRIKCTVCGEERENGV